MSMASQNAASVVIEQLSLAYDTTDVLKDVNLRIEPGELFTFLGPSAARANRPCYARSRASAPRRAGASSSARTT